MPDNKPTSRRRFLTAGSGISAAAILAACGDAANTPTTGESATAVPAAANATAVPAAATSAPAAATDAPAAPETTAPTTAATTADGETVLLVRPDIKGAYAAEAAVAAWNAQFPNKIRLDESGDGVDTKIQAAQAAGDLIWSGYAIIAVPWETQTYVKRGLIQPLDDYIAASTVPDAEKVVPAIIPTILESSKYEGKQYGIPGNVGSIALAWQTKVFEEVGIEKQPETWDEVYEAAKKIKAAKPELTPFDSANSPLCDLYAMIWGGQPDPYNADGLVDITGDTAVAALEWQRKMVQEELMPAVHKDSFGNWLKGGTAMITSFDVAGTLYEQTFGAGSAKTGTTFFKNAGETQAGVPFWMNASVLLNKAKNPQAMTDFYLWWFGPNNKENGKQIATVAAKPCYQYTYDEFIKNDPAQAWQLQGIELIRNSKPFNVNVPNGTEQSTTTPYIEQYLDVSQNLDARETMQKAIDDIKSALETT